MPGKQSKPVQRNSISPTERGILSKPLFQKFFLFAFAFLIYANTIPNGFNLDDELYHKRAVELSAMGPQGFVKAFTTPTFSEGSYVSERRPVPLWTFILQYRLAGPAPMLSHLINVLLYAFTCLALFQLLRRWLVGKNAWLPFFITLLFAAHPLHTEVVCSIKNRDELLAVLFVMLGYIAAWKYDASHSRKIPMLLLALFCFVLAVASKRTIAPFFLIAPLSWYFFGNASLRKVLLYTLVFLLPIIIFRGLAPFTEISGGYRQYFAHENPFYSAPGLMHRLPTILYIVGRYLLLHIFPYQLAYYYGLNYVTVVGWAQPVVWISLCVYLLLGYLVIRNFAGKRLVAFGILIFLLGIAMASNLPVLVPGLMAERYTYMSSLGFCIAMCAVAFYFGKDKAISVGRVHVALIVIASLYTIRTVARNLDWRDKDTLFAHDMPYLESSAKANYMYAEILARQARRYSQMASGVQLGNINDATLYRDSAVYLLSAAKMHYKHALEIDPAFPNALNNIGLIYVREDSPALAKQYLLRSLATTTDKARTYDDIGMIHMKQYSLDSAVFYFNAAIRSDSIYLNAYCNLSKVMVEMKDTVHAEQILVNASRKNSSSSIPYIQLADIALFKKDTVNMVYYCRKAAELRPANTAILAFLIKYYRDRGKTDSAGYYSHKMNELSNP